MEGDKAMRNPGTWRVSDRRWRWNGVTHRIISRFSVLRPGGVDGGVTITPEGGRSRYRTRRGLMRDLSLRATSAHDSRRGVPSMVGDESSTFRNSSVAHDGGITPGRLTMPHHTRVVGVQTKGGGWERLQRKRCPFMYSSWCPQPTSTLFFDTR